MNNFQDVFNRLIPGLSEIYGAELEKIILFGSVARGTNSPESDIDIAILIHNDETDRHNKMNRLIVDLELDYDVVISAVVIDYNNFKEWEEVLPFYINVKNDGVILWSAA